jgi:hypothetical protein
MILFWLCIIFIHLVTTSYFGEVIRSLLLHQADPIELAFDRIGTCLSFQRVLPAILIVNDNIVILVDSFINFFVSVRRQLIKYWELFGNKSKVWLSNEARLGNSDVIEVIALI